MWFLLEIGLLLLIVGWVVGMVVPRKPAKSSKPSKNSKRLKRPENKQE